VDSPVTSYLSGKVEVFERVAMSEAAIPRQAMF
jgi:hypothetical protein